MYCRNSLLQTTYLINPISGPMDGQTGVKKYAQILHHRGIQFFLGEKINDIYDITYESVIPKFGSNLTKMGNGYFIPFQQFCNYRYIVPIIIIGGGKHRTMRKPPTCHKSQTNIIS